jgi:hypothetical protein
LAPNYFAVDAFVLSILTFLVRHYYVKGRVRTGIESEAARSRSTRTRRSGRRQSDMSGSSFVLALLLITTVAAATADHPAFWLLLGPAPLAALTGAVVFMRSKGLQEK